MQRKISGFQGQIGLNKGLTSLGTKVI